MQIATPGGNTIGYGWQNDRVLSVTVNGQALISQINYEADGQRQSMTPSGGTTVTYTYDAANRLTQIAQAAGLGSAQPATAQTVGITYDTASRPTKLTLANSMTMNYAYNNGSELTSIAYKKADATSVGDLTYTYNTAGRRINTGGTLARSNLPAAVASAQHNANNPLTTKDAVNFTYDLNGNLANDDGSRTYTWNVRNQLVGISGSDTATFTYDAFGRRRSATVNGTSTSTLYDGWNPIQLQSGSTVIENRLYGLGLDAIYTRTRGSVTESYLRDGLNSIVELRNSTQNQTVQYTYDPYGGTTGSFASTNTIKYTGREEDTGNLYYYRMRYYSTALNRFVSESTAGGYNGYAYADGNPAGYAATLGAGGGAISQPAPIDWSGIGRIIRGIGPIGTIGTGLILGGFPSTIGDEWPNGYPSTGDDNQTQHDKDRKQDAREGDAHRDVGDANKVIRDGRKYRDTESGHTVYVDGDRVVIVDCNGKIVTRFKNSRRNTGERVGDGRWVPL